MATFIGPGGKSHGIFHGIVGCRRDIEALLNLVDVAVQEAAAASVGVSRARGVAALVGAVTLHVRAAAPTPT